MIDPAKIESALKRVKDQTTFVQSLLIDALGWPIDEAAQEIGDIAYEWTEDELRAAGLNEKIVGGKAYQIILPRNPWGIFVMEFANPDVFTTGRGMTGVLRRVLHGLVTKGRGGKNSNLPRFTQDNLLFICNHKYERYRFAHFKPATDGSGTPPMASFGWGPDDLDAVRTICEFNLRALEWPDAIPSNEAAWLKTWAPAFDVEKVTKRFYEDYAEVFHRVEDIIAKQKAFKGDELRMFTQSLFNRLMFLRFIERKGWLRLPGQQGTRYLAAVAAAGGVGRKSLYASRLRPLFFEGLAEDGKQKSDAYGSVPLLNGGLFEESPLDKKIADIPDEAFKPIIDHTGLFYRYNFTVEESTPLDIEVAVDPEMLGKVFEELVTGRHESGSYYTPRSVVAFMCREALKGHLADRTKAPEKAISRLVDDHVVAGLNEAHAKTIIDALGNLKAADPACGSGAYLLGLLQELVAIRRALQSEKLTADPGFLYDLKLHIISHNLYGVDIDPFATEIAKLRLWLSLAVEANKPVPLPNLDFKIETGDSLLGPDPHTSDLFRERLLPRADMLLELKDRYLKAHGNEKLTSRACIEKEEKALADELSTMRGRGVIDWRIHFAEVFVKAGGFDIVLANPPYVSAQEFTKTRSKEDRAALTEAYDTAKGAWDLYVIFFERGLQLLRPGGHLCFITPNKYLAAPYATALREYMLSTSELRSVTDISRLSVFVSASVYPVLTHLRKSKATSGEVQIFRPNSSAFEQHEVLTFRRSCVSRSILDLLPDHIWSFILSDRVELLQRLLTKTERMDNAGKVNATTTAAEADSYGSSLLEVKPSKGFKVINTGTIDPYKSLWGEVQLTHQKRKFLTPWLPRNVVSTPRGNLYEEPKIIFAKMAKSCEAVWDVTGEYAALNANCFYKPRVGLRLGYVVGYVHSAFFAFFYEQFFGALRMQAGYYQFQAPQLRVMPILVPSDDEQARIESLAIKAARGVDVAAIQAEIDQRLGRLFGVSPVELAASSNAVGTGVSGLPTVDEMLIAAEAWVDARKREGWTKEDFARKLPEFLTEDDTE